MATTRFTPSQKPAGSPRPKGRENAKDTLCRNVLIYGHCRYEDQGCAFNHEPNKVHGSQSENRGTAAGMDGFIRKSSEKYSDPEENDVVLFTTRYIEARAKHERSKSQVAPDDGGLSLINNDQAKHGLDTAIDTKPFIFKMDEAMTLKYDRVARSPRKKFRCGRTPKMRRDVQHAHQYPLVAQTFNLVHPLHGPLCNGFEFNPSIEVNPFKANPLFSFSKKTFNVDSPSFVPAGLSNAGGSASAISSRAASATPFIPRDHTAAGGATTPNLHVEEQPAFNAATSREFTPQNYDLSNTVSLNGAPLEAQTPYDPFTIQSVPSASYNPYLDDSSGLAPASANPYYQTQPSYSAPVQPLQHHLYAPRGPHREDLLPYQKPAHDFFMPEKLREELQKQAEASLQVIPGTQLPTLDPYHGLVALDTNPHKSAAVFGYPTWVYKARSTKNGKLYCLRRLEGYRLSNEMAIRSVKEWRRVDSGGIVNVVDSFTTRAFGDSSLIFVTDYHPLSKNLVEQHFNSNHRYGARGAPAVQESVLWGYIVQIASAIKAAHVANLAIRCMEPSKVLLTGKNRVRLNACSILDVVQFEAQRPITDLQQEDLQHFGRLICSLATTTIVPPNVSKAVIDQLSHAYSPELRDTVLWLLAPASKPAVKTIDDFLQGISTRIIATFDSALHENDTIYSEFSRELENGRLARLLMKLGTINERPEFEGDPNWAENGERYMLKLFRDYVFHQVDGNGNAVVDLAHIVSCLNKLDVGTDEKIVVTSRDDQTVFLVSYKELKKQVNAAFAELTKPAKPGRGYP